MPGSRRRQLLGLLAGGAALAACAPLPRRAPPFRLAPAHVSAERVQEVLVGLRPYRPAGFVVRAEPLGTRRLVHNYGHGGAGITLSWGSSLQAVELGFAGAGVGHAVIGCGVMGLTTACLLQRGGARATIYARDLPPDTTSNIAGGHWSPYSAFEPHAASEAFLAQYRRAVEESFRGFEALVGTRGVSWRRSFALSERFMPFGARYESLRGLLPEMRLLGPGEHPFGEAHVQSFTSLLIEPGRYLAALMSEFLEAGGRLERRTFASAAELAALPEPVIFNCTGLGARELFGDTGLVPARGQLVKLLPQPEVDYNLFAHGGYMFPRSDGIVLGGTFEPGDTSLEPDPRTTQRILERAARAMARLAA